MSLFTTLLRPAPVRAPGRHTDTWLKQQQANVELQAERDTAREDIEQLKQRHARERAGWQDALRLAGAEAMGYAAERDEARTRSNANRDGWLTARAEVERLRATLRALEVPAGPDAAPGQAALMDDPAAWINQPDGPPRPDEWISPVAPQAPAESEAADVHAETLAVDVADLRAGAEATQQLDVTAIRNATGLGATAVLPVVALEPARHPKPEAWPPARPTGARTLADAFGAADLKPDVTPTALPRGNYAVRFAKTH
jgi:hypothetical protein